MSFQPFTTASQSFAPMQESVEGGIYLRLSDQGVIIGNGHFSRTYQTIGGRLSVGSILNRRVDGAAAEYLPGEASQEFILRFLSRRKRAALSAGDLTIDSISYATVSGGKALCIAFQPANVLGVPVTARLVAVLKEQDHFLREYIEVSVPKQQADSLTLDSLDLLSFHVQQGQKTWSRPEMKPANISGFHMGLGQPVYLGSLFLGCEFPAADTRIEDATARTRYYSGKPFSRLKKTQGVFLSWPAVLGVARSDDKEVLQSDFFRYIETISTKTEFRKQYNSWYDHMLDITSENIVGSFYEMEKGLTQHGVAPMDAYVVDDGWNDYTKGFWCFNDKFPQELYPSAALAKKFASNFGLWLGPRGGYTLDTPRFAKHIQKAGTGFRNPKSNDICVAAPVYQQGVKKLFLDFMQRFDLNYWKLDGFALRPCPKKKHGHMTGGEHDMYFTTELWENWTDIFAAMRAQREEQGKSLWINFTCYVNPSPWFLQWVNSIWMQNSGDHSFQIPSKGGSREDSDVDRMMTYRDDRYFDFVRTRDLQFPLAHLYNHDPIYGNTVKSPRTKKTIQATTDEFRKFLYQLAARGTSFWELYFSYNMLDEEKWQVCAELLRWAEENFHILRNAKLIGRTPAGGDVYGYSAWDGGEGIVSLRNPANFAQDYEITLDRLIGVKEGVKDLVCLQVLPYAAKPDGKTYQYGGRVKLTLAPHEVRILRFGAPDRQPAALHTAKTISDRVVSLCFDKRVSIGEAKVLLNGVQAELTLCADYHTVLASCQEAFVPNEAVEIAVSLIDCAGNQVHETARVTAYPNDVIFHTQAASGKELAQRGVEGRGDFTLTFPIAIREADALLVTQEGAFVASIDANGKLCFAAGGVSVTSTRAVNDGKQRSVAAVREKNGMLKLYLDGALDASAYCAEQINETLPAGPVKAEKLAGGEVRLLNRALAFDEVAK